MVKQIFLKAGPADGESILIDSDLNYIRVCKVADISGIILTDSNSTHAVDVVEQSYCYRRSIQNEFIFEYDEE